MKQKRASFVDFPNLPGDLLEKSLTYKDGQELTGGSNVKCQCGWRGTFVETTEVRFFNGSGDRTSTLYLCRKSPHILAGIIHNPPISFEDQREAADQRRKK